MTDLEAMTARAERAEQHAEALERMIADLCDEAEHDFPAIEEVMDAIDHESPDQVAIWLAAQVTRYHRADAENKAVMRSFHLDSGVAEIRRVLNEADTDEGAA